MTRATFRVLRALSCGAVLSAALAPLPARAQILIPRDRPGDERPALPRLEAPGPEAPEPILPPAPPLPERPETGPDPQVRILVREIRITENTAVSSEVLEQIAAPYENRALSWSELTELRDRLTLAYVERGFVSSGAVIPEQHIENGVLEIRIVEGRLEQVEIETDGRFRPGYFRSRLERGGDGPVDVALLERRLQLLQEDPRVERVEAQLVPGETRGTSILRVAVHEAPWYELGADFDNYRSPSIGALGGTVQAHLDNLIGLGDNLFARFTGSEGLRQVEAMASLPVTSYDTLFALRYQGSWADVVDDEFDFLDVRSESQTGSAEIAQPLYRTLGASISGLVRFERRHADSEIGLLGIGVPSPGADDGVTDVTALRFGLEGTLRTRQQAIALRSLLSWGIGVLGATEHGSDLPDSSFVAWLGQAQWARRLPWLDMELLARIDAQVSDAPLLPLEQIAIGGRYSVRGYRENTLVRDEAVLGSLELRVPVFESHGESVRMRIELAPFVDASRSWNHDQPEVGPGTLASVGIGIRGDLTRWTRFEFYWGHAFEDVDYEGESDIQDEGFHFGVAVRWP